MHLTLNNLQVSWSFPHLQEYSCIQNFHSLPLHVGHLLVVTLVKIIHFTTLFAIVKPLPLSAVKHGLTINIYWNPIVHVIKALYIMIAKHEELKFLSIVIDTIPSSFKEIYH